jgi:hypothetical protein
MQMYSQMMQVYQRNTTEGQISLIAKQQVNRKTEVYNDLELLCRRNEDVEESEATPSRYKATTVGNKDFLYAAGIVNVGKWRCCLSCIIHGIPSKESGLYKGGSPLFLPLPQIHYPISGFP